MPNHDWAPQTLPLNALRGATLARHHCRDLGGGVTRSENCKNSGGVHAPANFGSRRLDKMSATLFATPGRWATTSGSYAHSAASNAYSRAIKFIAPGAAFNELKRVSAPILSERSLKHILRSRHRRDHNRQAMRMHSASNACCPRGSPPLYPKASSSEAQMSSLNHWSGRPLIESQPPKP